MGSGEPAGVRRDGDQVQRDFPQRRLAGERLQDVDGLAEGARVEQLLLRPREAHLRAGTGQVTSSGSNNRLR